jgi:hypothetical protein
MHRGDKAVDEKKERRDKVVAENEEIRLMDAPRFLDWASIFLMEHRCFEIITSWCIPDVLYCVCV